MILPKHLINRVLRGEKQQHRVPAKTRKAPWVVGDTIAITRHPDEREGMARTPCYVEITTIYQQGLHELSDTEVRAEGFDDREALYDYWREKYNDGPLSEPLVWVGGFKVVEKLRYLAVQQGQEHPEQYTTSASRGLPDEPPSVSDDALEGFAREARGADEARRRRERARKPLPTRVADLEKAAREGDQRAQRQLFVIRQRVEAHERGEPREPNGDEKAA